MTSSLALVPEAKADVADAYLWYEEQGLGLGMDFLRCVEAALRRWIRSHDLANRIKHDLELAVILALKRLQFPRQVGVALQHPSEPDERAHNLDVNLHGARTAQDAGEHGNALFGECVRRCTPTAPT